LITQRLGPAFSNEGTTTKWNGINKIAETGGDMGITVTDGSITINYSGHKERSVYITELLKNLIKDIDDQLQVS
jgi:hypothetical protein